MTMMMFVLAAKERKCVSNVGNCSSLLSRSLKKQCSKISDLSK